MHSILILSRVNLDIGIMLRSSIAFIRNFGKNLTFHRSDSAARAALLDPLLGHAIFPCIQSDICSKTSFIYSLQTSGI